MSDISYQESVYGCIFGGAVGDALGLRVEFMALSSIHDEFGQGGITEPALVGGLSFVSDDTQMTLFTLDGLFSHLCTSGTDVVHEVRDAYFRWYATQERDNRWLAPDEPLRLEDEPVLNHLRAPGATCCTALAKGVGGTMESPVNDRKGCGGVMRVAPIGLVRQWTPAECFHIGAQTAAITHGHPTGYLCAGAMALIIRELVGGENPLTACKHALRKLEHYPGHEETSKAIELALSLVGSKAPPSAEIVSSLGEGWIGEEALAIGLFCALAAGSYTEAIVLASNHSGDSDSTASIAGQLYGAWHGTSSVPEEWVKQLDVYDVTSRLIEDFLNANP
jgi:ADP-ribosyl-[dinitrogen reductase] hydrolase